MTQPQAKHGAEEWGADFFGGLNEMPPEPVAGLGQLLDAMTTLAAFRDARQWLLGRSRCSAGRFGFGSRMRQWQLSGLPPRPCRTARTDCGN